MTEKGATSDKSASAKQKSADAGKDVRAKDSPSSAVKSETTGNHSSPKKRRKVNHGEYPVCACGRRQGSGAALDVRTHHLFQDSAGRWFMLQPLLGSQAEVC